MPPGVDTLTHAFVPYAAYRWGGRPSRQRLAAAMGGLAPDLDAFWAWMSHAHEYAYPLVHRGFSHTLWGAPLLATGFLFLLTRPVLRKRWKRFEAFAWTPDVLAPLWVGAWTHLLLDGLTITGTPLLWPFDDARFTTDWFFFGVLSLMPLSLFLWIQVFRGKASDRFVRGGAIAMALLLAISGAVRAYAYPRDLAGDEDVTPGPNEWTWIVSQRNASGVLVYDTQWGGRVAHRLFLPEANRTAAQAAIGACAARPGHLPWNWYLGGLPVVNATRRTDVGWSLEYDDSMWVFTDEFGTWGGLRSPAREASDPGRGAHCEFDPDGNAVFTRDRGWIGS